MIFMSLNSAIQISDINGSIDNQEIAQLACLLGRKTSFIQFTGVVLDEKVCMKYYTKDNNKNKIKIYDYVNDIKVLRTIRITTETERYCHFYE
jgi:hypothetical protein